MLLGFLSSSPLPPSVCLLLLEPPSCLTWHWHHKSVPWHIFSMWAPPAHTSVFRGVPCSSASPLEFISTIKSFTATCSPPSFPPLGLVHAGCSSNSFLLGVYSLLGCGLSPWRQQDFLLWAFLLHYPTPPLLLPSELPLLCLSLAECFHLFSGFGAGGAGGLRVSAAIGLLGPCGGHACCLFPTETGLNP